jgi:hypothetical protein
VPTAPGSVSLDFDSVGDTYVGASNGNANFGSQPEFNVSPNSNNPERALVQFDLSAIPDGSTIHSATFRVCPTNLALGAVGRSHHVHRVLDSWGELSVVWNTQPGVLEPDTDETAVLAGLLCLNFQVEDDVQAWVDGAANYGWQLGDSNENAVGTPRVRYASRENSDASARPKLTINWTPPAVTNSPTPAPTPTPTPTATPTPPPVTPTPSGLLTATLIADEDAYVHSNAGDHNHGGDKKLIIDSKSNDIARVLLKFDLSSIPSGATIVDATLTLCSNNDYPDAGGRIHDVHHLNSAWSESNVTWDTQPVAGSKVAAVVYPGVETCVGFAVGASVQTWVSGGANHGWRISDSNEGNKDADVEYLPHEENNSADGPFLVIDYLP